MGITIIGAGNMARGIGSRLVAAGEPVTIMDRTPEHAEALAHELKERATSGATVTTAALGDPIKDNTVVLALFYPIEKEVVPQLREQLTGKTIVEITNPLNESFDDLATPEGTSAAEEVAAMVPDAKVVKAFNTTFAGTLTAGQVQGVRTEESPRVGLARRLVDREASPWRGRAGGAYDGAEAASDAPVAQQREAALGEVDLDAPAGADEPHAVGLDPLGRAVRTTGQEHAHPIAVGLEHEQPDRAAGPAPERREHVRRALGTRRVPRGRARNQPRDPRL